MQTRYRLAVLNSHPIQYFAPLYRHLSSTEDIDVTVFYCSRQGLAGGYVDPGFGREIVWDIPLLEGYRSKFLPALWGDRGVNGFFSPLNLSIARELWRGRFNAVIIHGHNSATNLLAVMFARLSGTSVFMRGETHLSLERSLLKQWLRRPVMTFFYRFCDACLFIGTWNRQFYEHHSVSADKLFSVPYTVDNAFFTSEADRHKPTRRSLKQQLGVEDDTPTVLFASKLIARKRPMDLLVAFSRLRERGVNAALVFIGEGPLRSELERLVAERRISDVRFVGFVNQSELPKYYVAADVFVLPSENEPWGLIVNEVMCAGLPVITTTDVGAAPDLIIDGETGFLYESGDVDALTDRLEILLRNPARARIMGAKARELMATWNYDRCIKGIRAALKKTSLRNAH